METPQKQVVGFMAFAVVFGLIGETIKLSPTTTSGPPVGGGDVKIIIGGAIGTVLLVLLSEAGSGGETLAKGLAALTMVASILINGGPVFQKISTMTAKGTPAPHLVTTPKVG